MRPSTAAARRFSLATLAETWSTIRSTPLPSVAFSTSSAQAVCVVSTARSAPNSFSRSRRLALVEVPITSRAPLSLAICMPIRPTPELAPWISTRLARLEPAGGDEGVVHGLQRDRQRRRLLVAHVVGGDGRDAAPIGDRILRIAAVARAHDAVARLDVLDLAADRLDLAGELKPEHGARPAGAAVHMAGSHDEVGAVESGRPDAHEDLAGARLGLGHVADLDAAVRQHCRFHDAKPPLAAGRPA